MRLVAPLLGALAAGSTLALMTPAPAFAATGTLTINGTRYLDPAPGCYPRLTDPGSAEIENRTNVRVFIFSTTDCRGGYLGYLGSNSTARFIGANTVQVDE